MAHQLGQLERTLPIGDLGLREFEMLQRAQTGKVWKTGIAHSGESEKQKTNSIKTRQMGNAAIRHDSLPYSA
ncbi:MAG: hypothetical protein AAF411_03060 [Myxococcota bacterium]